MLRRLETLTLRQKRASLAKMQGENPYYDYRL